jgi:hypothetical protein
MAGESLIIKFYEKRATDNRGRSLDDMQHYNYKQLENKHDYIQWMFPLSEKSSANPSAPILTLEDTLYIRKSDVIKQNMLTSVRVMTDFLGFKKDDTGNKYITISDRNKVWPNTMNHNFERITRMLKSLVLFYMRNEAELLFKYLEEVRNNDNQEIIGESFLYWKKAIE